ncbi:alpha/beta hydrolase-fold protein [Hamadaea sp. NPDC050747]|uniref:alpha/beta hydrolase-fold protein n=1 Tax=Hamadaea sp. NPDC050747 TaxID=3155789 RepID=UPI0034002F7B
MKRFLIPVLSVLVLLIGGVGTAEAGRTRPGTLVTGSAPSAALGEDIHYTAYLPDGYASGTDRYPVLYLLHGRGDTMAAWTTVKSTLDDLIQAEKIPPLIAILPDAPWSDRGSWYVDSQYQSGKAVETALTDDLVQNVDATYRTAPIRQARLVGGYSMGGAGALRIALAHPDLFSAAIVLSPAVYTPLPPADSSARDYGAYGVGDQLFDDQRYQELNYPALLARTSPDLPVQLFIAVGDDEWANPDPADARHDLDFESEALYNAARRAPGVSAQMRILDGGHDWSVWAPAFAQAIQYLGPTLSTVPPQPLPTPLLGTAGTDWAGGIASAGGDAYTVGFAASASVDGQAYHGKLDAVVTRPGTWTTEFGTAADERLYGVVAQPDGGVLVAGYTKGDLDGQHAGNAADDAFVASLDASGTVRWITQFGAAGVADRAYGLAASPDGGAYVTGYTKGALDGANAGDKDTFLAGVSPSGQLQWVRQLGGTAEDKAFAVTAGTSDVYVTGTAGSPLPGATGLGGYDGFVARYTDSGTLSWVKAVGGSGDDRLDGVTVSGGYAVATGTANGDLIAVSFSSNGSERWTTTVDSGAADGGVAVVARSDGGVDLVGYTRGRVTVAAGGADVLRVRLSAKGAVLAKSQFGSPRDEVVDAFAEPNLFAAAAPDGRVLVAGLTFASSSSGDVFATFAP